MLTPRTAGRVFADGCPRTTDHRSPAFAGLLRKSSQAGRRGRLITQIFFFTGGRVGCGCPPRLNSQRSTKNPQRSCAAFTLEKQRARASAFTLLELLIVVGIVVLLMVLIAPAFTTIKSGTDVTSAAYTIKGVLDTARTYAKANNTYTWVGFYEENIANPASPNSDTPPVGRLVMSIVASTDGTTVYNPNSQINPDPIDHTRLIQVNKLVKIENIHLPLFAIGSGTGDTFETRPALQNDPGAVYNYSRFGELNGAIPNTAPYTNSQFPFWYPLSAASASLAQYYFQKTLQFSPTGECRINSTYDVRKVIEVGLLQTHGTAVPPPIGGGGSTLIYSGNVAAVQITGFGGNVKIYRR